MESDTTQIAITDPKQKFATVMGRQFPLETRTIRGVDQETKVDILVVTGPEMFPDADGYKSVFTVDQGNRNININVRGMSYGEWEAIEVLYPQPRFDQERAGVIEYQREFTKESDKVKLQRKVALIEHCTGWKIPGDTLEEKAEALSKRIPESQTNEMYEFVMSEGSNFPAETDPIIAKLAMANMNETLSVTDFDSWQKVCEETLKFHMKRPQEDWVIEIPIKQISEKDKRTIEEQCQLPIPPSRPGRDPVTQKISEAHPIYNHEDDVYQKACSEVRVKSRIMRFEASVFKIPGNSHEEKKNWLGRRLLGDILLIEEFLTKRVYNSRGTVDFF